jgi:hypothetical protein
MPEIEKIYSRIIETPITGHRGHLEELFDLLRNSTCILVYQNLTAQSRDMWRRKNSIRDKGLIGSEAEVAWLMVSIRVGWNWNKCLDRIDQMYWKHWCSGLSGLRWFIWSSYSERATAQPGAHSFIGNIVTSYACCWVYCMRWERDLSASSRISKGQGYQGFLRKRAWSSFGQKRAICVVQWKTWNMDRISLLLGSIKCFPISFNTFKTL